MRTSKAVRALPPPRCLSLPPGERHVRSEGIPPHTLPFEARMRSRGAQQRGRDPLTCIPLEVPCPKSGMRGRTSAGFCPASRREAPCRESWTRGRISIDDTAAQRGALSCFAFVLFRFTGTLRCLTLSVKTFSLPAGIADACSIWGAAEA